MTQTYLPSNNSPMRPLVQVAIAFFAILLVISTIRCSEEKATPNEADRVRDLLVSGAWIMQSVDVSGIDKTSVYDGLQLTFTESGYTSVNGGAVWPASGTWQFVDETATSIQRNDGLVIAIGTIDATSLRLELVWEETTFGSGRVSSLAGQHTFVFGRP